MERLLEPAKDYINFPDFLFNLSSVNNKSLFDVANYLDCRGLDQLSVFSLGPHYEILPKKDPQDIIHYFLENTMSAVLPDHGEWVLADGNSLDRLPVEVEQELTKVFDGHINCYFKKSDLLSFEPLNGFLHFESENPIDKKIEENDRKYILVTKYVNDLGKGKSIGSGKPLKITVKYILENIPLNEVDLYKSKGINYLLVSQASDFKYKNATDILRSVYDILDDEQMGTVSSDREPFEGFYFKYSQVRDLSSIGFKKVAKKKMIHLDKLSSTNNSKSLDNKSMINNLGENQRLLTTYALFTPEDLTCLLIDENPACISHNDNYLRHHHMVSNAIDAKLLTLNDEGKVLAEQAKTWLASHGFVYKSFNDGALTYLDQLAEVEEEAIAANVKILNLTAKLEDAELDSIIHNHTAHKFLLGNAQATIDQLLKENAELRANKNIEASQPKYDDDVRGYKIASLMAENEQLEAKFNNAQAEITTLKNQLKKINDHQREVSAIDQVLEFDWYNLDRVIYPPELHLGLALWQQMYQSNKMQNTYHNSHNSRFEVAAKRLGLNPQGSLGKRLNTVTNPVRSKIGQYALAKQLWDIKILNIPVVLVKKPK